MAGLPERWPQPITSWQFGHDLNLAIQEILLALCVQTSAPNRIDNGPTRRVRSDNAVVGGSAGASPVRGEIERVAVEKLLLGDAGHIDCQSGDDVKTILICIGVQGIIGSPVESSIAKSTSLDFIIPVRRADAVLECVFKDQTVLQNGQ